MKNKPDTSHKALNTLANLWSGAYRADYNGREVSIEIIRALLEFGFTEDEGKFIYHSKHLRWFFNGQGDHVEEIRSLPLVQDLSPAEPTPYPRYVPNGTGIEIGECMKDIQNRFKMWMQDLLATPKEENFYYEAYDRARYAASDILSLQSQDTLLQIFTTLGLALKVKNDIGNDEIIIWHPGNKLHPIPNDVQIHSQFGSRYWARIDGTLHEFWPLDRIKDSPYQARTFFKFLGELFVGQYALSKGKDTFYIHEKDEKILSEKISPFLHLLG